MRFVGCCIALALAIAGWNADAVAGTPIAGFVETQTATGLSAPTAIAFLPDGRLVVTEKGGALKLVDAGAASTLTTIPVCNSSEMGLLGVAVDPDFGTNGFLYLYRTKPPVGGCGDVANRFNQVVRVTMSGNAVNLASLVELVTGMQTDNGNHDGGGLRIGPDGKLYVGVGDTGNGDNQGGPGSSTNPYSQDLTHLEGKVLRLNLDGTAPSDNPFFNQAPKRAEIFAYGFRNPFRFGFDPLSGALWVADVGDFTIEEIDIVGSGANLSWPYCEGDLPGGCRQPGDVAPIFTYPHSGGSSLGTSITGGAFAGVGYGALGSDYFFGDYTGSRLYYAPPNAGRNGLAATPSLFVDNADGPVDVVFGPDGALYYVAINAGEVRRVASTVGPPTNIDTYACYRAVLAKGEAALPKGTEVDLQDQFDASPQSFEVQKAIGICNPASRDGSAVIAATVHQESFGIKRPAGSPKFAQSAHVTIDDFGARDLTLTNPSNLLVPSNKVLGGGGAPPYGGTAIDHYKCYKAKLSKGQPKFVAPAAPVVSDEFLTTGQPLSVKKITKLCTPVAADGSVINHPESHLVCYQVKLPAGVKLAKTTVSTNNPDFGADVLIATAPSEICLPAAKDP